MDQTILYILATIHDNYQYYNNIHIIYYITNQIIIKNYEDILIEDYIHLEVGS